MRHYIWNSVLNHEYATKIVNINFQILVTMQKINQEKHYPFTVFKTRSFSERLPLPADHGTSALTKTGAGP